MLGKLILIFILTPITELFLLIEISQRIGTLNVIGLVMFTGIVGAFLAKWQGLSVLRKVKTDLRAGILPTNQMFDGVLILAGGILLITPGVLTDALGFILLIPHTRTWTKERLKKWLRDKMDPGEIRLHFT
ncbi:MAG: FxsA family protein [Methanocellales archaeon]|nr:FxsA family protein [Methanocellales archaeon]MDD3291076.1 FxsA family protein [Methanocellales archaeon]MDD5234961.1 FxsA family protein [Methanocellales archaeon]MDD5484668.1 FxsA family protein [Methanocellales archaeon]